jgi:hypothetical protein
MRWPNRVIAVRPTVFWWRPAALADGLAIQKANAAKILACDIGIKISANIKYGTFL